MSRYAPPDDLRLTCATVAALAAAGVSAQVAADTLAAELQHVRGIAQRALSLQPPPPIVLCAECPRAAAVLAAVRK